MKNLFVWIILISTAAVGVAVAQPTGDDLLLTAQVEQQPPA